MEFRSDEKFPFASRGLLRVVSWRHPKRVPSFSDPSRPLFAVKREARRHDRISKHISTSTQRDKLSTRPITEDALTRMTADYRDAS